jgi:type IV pilus assembly protein PilA
MSERRTCRGYSAVEMLIAAALLGLLAAVAIPQFAAPDDATREAELISALETFRSAIDTYWSQHEALPAQDGDGALLVEQLGSTTDAAGRVGEGARHRLGPYLPEGGCPRNPFSGEDSVRVVDHMPGRPSGDSAWIYDRSSGQVRCNVPGATPDGTLYFEL